MCTLCAAHPIHFMNGFQVCLFLWQLEWAKWWNRLIPFLSILLSCQRLWWPSSVAMNWATVIRGEAWDNSIHSRRHDPIQNKWDESVARVGHVSENCFVFSVVCVKWAHPDMHLCFVVQHKCVYNLASGWLLGVAFETWLLALRMLCVAYAESHVSISNDLWAKWRRQTLAECQIFFLKDKIDSSHFKCSIFRSRNDCACVANPTYYSWHTVTNSYSGLSLVNYSEYICR